MEELRQSNYILQQCLDYLPPGPIVNDDAPDLVMPKHLKPGWKPKISGFGSSLLEFDHKDTGYPHGDVYVSVRRLRVS